ncbi:hypothetical protein GZ77_26765 [Endozoicomonas montiporae]|uniref:RNA polymerase sigma factor 70 region 4 type 2 domain-containing protein n=1 Tax=Endozoicomonas montiporae TaxID=1027273 RepID=A0A081MYB9_9GAMM|nr:sigma factor-like helix-turn-helix DNA-binding protein [Endozoicomonas montiporae]KEQ11192.1 hypothetical protein GZ77_26765 [Endozoicomonas montiporae]
MVSMRLSPKQINPLNNLHPVKRRRLLSAIAEHGYTNKEAAKALGLTESAVKRQLENLRADYEGSEELDNQKKTDASNQLQLLGLAAKHDQI